MLLNDHTVIQIFIACPKNYNFAKQYMDEDQICVRYSVWYLLLDESH